MAAMQKWGRLAAVVAVVSASAYGQADKQPCAEAPGESGGSCAGTSLLATSAEVTHKVATTGAMLSEDLVPGPGDQEASDLAQEGVGRAQSGEDGEGGEDEEGAEGDAGEEEGAGGTGGKGLGPLPAYAKDQCSNPEATVSAEMTFPENGGWWGSQNDWLGKCVTAQWEEWDGTVRRINVKVGQTLPNPGTCSNVAKQFNGGPSPPNWDFSGTGWCGAGSCKNVWTNCAWDIQSTAVLHHGRLACLAHDACVWARCQEDALVPAAAVAFSSDKSGSIGWGEIRDFFNRGQAEARLRAGDPICGKAIMQVANAYFDATNSRIKKFRKNNKRPNWWNRRRWR